MNNLPLLPLQKGQKPYAGKDVDRTKFIRLYVISAVDYETGYCEVTGLEEPGFIPLVRLPSAHSSLRSCIRAMPEIGSVVLCGSSRQTPTAEDLVIVGFVDLDLESLLEYKLFRSAKTPKELKLIETIKDKLGYNVIKGKRRKIYPGEIQAESNQGAELYLDDDVYLSDSKLNEIEIRSFDKSIRLSSNQLYTLTQASRSWNGLIVRDPSDLQPVIQQAVLPNGQKVQFITDTKKPLYMGGRAFTEHRTELYELSDGVMKASGVNSGYDDDLDENGRRIQLPLLTTVMGTLVGNDKTDTAKYSKILRPQIFGASNATDISLDYLECKPEEWSSLASSFHIKQSSNAQIDIDKEGHLFTFFAASSKDYRSWDAGFGGSVKLVIGADKSLNQSLDINTKGGVQAILGTDITGKSCYVAAKGGIHIEVMESAKDGYAYYLATTKGVHKTYIQGNCVLDVKGDYTVTVGGKFIVQSLGTKEENYVEDKNNVYGGSYKKIVMKDKQEQIGYNSVVQIAGNLQRAPGVFTPATPKEVVDSKLITVGSQEETLTAGDIRRKLLLGDLKALLTAGNIQEDLLLGSRITNVTKGDITRQITAKSTVGFKDDIKVGDHVTNVGAGSIIQNIKGGPGCSSTESIITANKKISIKTGAFTIEITAGDINISTKAGKIKVDSSTQTVDINGMASVTVKGAKINLSGPNVDIGPAPAAMGGIIVGQPGMPSHLDFICGLPLIGRPTIRA